MGNHCILNLFISRLQYNLRCATQNPLAAQESLTPCANCQREYIYSFSNFEPLPLVEFTFDPDITDQEAYGLIDTADFKEQKDQIFFNLIKFSLSLFSFQKAFKCFKDATQPL